MQGFAAHLVADGQLVGAAGEGRRCRSVRRQIKRRPDLFPLHLSFVCSVSEEMLVTLSVGELLMRRYAHREARTMLSGKAYACAG